MPKTGLPNYQPIPQSPAGGRRGRKGGGFDPLSLLAGGLGLPSFAGGDAGPAYSDATAAPIWGGDGGVFSDPFVSTGPFATGGSSAAQTGTPGGSVGAITAGQVVWLALIGIGGFALIRWAGRQ